MEKKCAYVFKLGKTLSLGLYPPLKVQNLKPQSLSKFDFMTRHLINKFENFLPS